MRNLTWVSLCLLLAAHSLPAQAQLQSIFWVERDTSVALPDDRIMRSDFPFTSVDEILEERRWISDLAIDTLNRRLVWTEAQTGVISCNFDGSAVDTLYGKRPCGIGSYGSIAVDEYDRKIIWGQNSDCGGLSIERSNLDGTDVELDLYPNTLALPYDITIGTDRYYWADGVSPGSIKWINKDTTEIGTLIDNEKSGAVVYLGGEFSLGWIASGKIRIGNQTGQVVSEFSPATAYGGLAYDRFAGDLYWIESDKGRIRKAALADTIATTIIDGLEGPRALALLVNSSSTGRGEQKRQLIIETHIFPNPAADVVRVSLPGPNHGTLIVSNTVGQKVTQQVFGGGSSSVNIPISHLAAGLYIVSFVRQTDAITLGTFTKL